MDTSRVIGLNQNCRRFGSTAACLTTCINFRTQETSYQIILDHVALEQIILSFLSNQFCIIASCPSVTVWQPLTYAWGLHSFDPTLQMVKVHEIRSGMSHMFTVESDKIASAW